MDASPWGLIKTVLPRLPLILKTVVLNILSVSPAAGLQDTRTEVATTLIRSILERRGPLKKTQEVSCRDPGIKGSVWVANCVVPAPEAEDLSTEREILDVRQALARAIAELGDGHETYTVPEVKDIEAEWTGYRSNVAKKAPRPDLPEDEQYKHLMNDANRTSDTTILYLHGGAYVVMDPATHRVPVSNLCKRVHGRALSLRYRLAPQNPFPAALLDAFIAYLYLLYPPADSWHDSIKASSIIFSGDSAGGGLATALLLLLLTLRRTGIHQIRFHGKEVDIPVPGGVVLNSPWVDISRSMPSVYRNAKYDYISPPSKAPAIPPVPMEIPPDDVWPASPPRIDTYCDASMIIHPLVSPIAAKDELWEGHPPTWISTGSEGLQDEDLILSKRFAATGPTILEVFEGMPHVFSFMFVHHSWSLEWFQSCAAFCNALAEGKELPQTSARWWTGTQGPQRVDVATKVMDLIGDDVEIDRRLLAGREWRLKAEAALVKTWKDTTEKDAARGKL